MRVLHTIASLDPSSGGPARSVPQLLIALKEAGADVRLWVAGFTEPDWRRELTEHGIPVEFVTPPNLSQVTLIHDHGLWLPSNHRAAGWARESGIPRIVSPRGMLEPWALNHRKWKKRLAWWLYQRRDLHTAVALHATAPSEEAQFRKLGLKMPVFVIPNGVALPKEASRVEGRESMAEGGKTEKPKVKGGNQITPQANQKTALFLSRIHPKKGLPMLVEAWARVRPPGWRMRVIGPDELGHRAEIAALVEAAGLGNCWNLEGEADDSGKWEAIAGADLFILPTYSENFGISIAEALAGGLPVITTTGAPWGGLLDHGCGWWVEPSVDELTRSLAEATSTPIESLREMGARGRKWVAHEFSWKGIAQSMIKAYKTMVPSES